MKFQFSLYTIFSKKIYYLTEQETDQAAPDQFTIPLNKFALAASTASVCTSSGVAVAVGATGNSTQSQSRQCSRQSSQVLQRLWSFQLWQNANILILPYYSARRLFYQTSYKINLDFYVRKKLLKAKCGSSPRAALKCPADVKKNYKVS